MAKENNTSTKKNSKLLVVIIIMLLVFVLLLGGVLYYFLIYNQPEQNVKQTTGGQREVAALKGSIKVMTEEEIQAELDKIVDEGMFRISIASDIVGIERGKNEVRIENPINNRYVMQVSIFLDETGEEIYATDLIDPGYYIQETEYDKELEAGTYDATAIFTALYPDNEEIVGTVGAQVRLIVLPAGSTPTPSPTPSPTPTMDPETTPSASPEN